MIPFYWIRILILICYTQTILWSIIFLEYISCKINEETNFRWIFESKFCRRNEINSCSWWYCFSSWFTNVGFEWAYLLEMHMLTFIRIFYAKLLSCSTRLFVTIIKLLPLCNNLFLGILSRWSKWMNEQNEIWIKEQQNWMNIEG